jgi:phosphomannomutase
VVAPFKAYDVRGIYGKEIHEKLAYQLGRAYILHTQAKSVVVARDMRPSSIPLSEQLIAGLRDQGAEVTYIGLASTDMLYFSVIHLQSDGGIVVTASHNPVEYNGFKFTRKNAIPIGLESGLAEIEALVSQGNFPQAPSQGTLSHQELLKEFVQFMHSFVDIHKLRPMKVVIDTGNGMGGHILPTLFEGSPLEVIPLFWEVDGTFPNHEANPLLEENRVDLVKKVKETQADLGIGLDGDTDRAFFVDGKGEFIGGDFILGLLAQPLLEEFPGALITYDVRCSTYVQDVVARYGGKSLMWKVGHAPMKNFMREVGARFGGEVSGHYYFKYEDSFFDSGNLTSLLLLKVLSDRHQSLAEALEETKNYYVSGEINTKNVQNPDQVIEELKQKYGSQGKIIEIDGLNIHTERWWFNVRKSNTEPLLRLNCEGKTLKEMEKIRDEILLLIRSKVQNKSISTSH